MQGSEIPFRQPPDRLRIFVSSTIGECSLERARARDAIASLNHEPFLFEEAGARPYPPRALYLRKLHDSDIFVGIYRHSYGWVAPDTTISGLEDEYREAIKSGMPCLLYIYSDGIGRDQRLTALISDFGQDENTFYRYQVPDDLYGRIRDDVTSVVVGRFLRMRSVEPIVVADSSDDKPKDSSEPSIPRPQLEQAILDRLNSDSILELVGEPGSGKTTALSFLAKNNGFIFFSAGNSQSAELIQSVINRLRIVRAANPEYFVSPDSALAALEEELERHNGVTFAFDDLAHGEFRTIFSGLIKRSKKSHRLVYSVDKSIHTLEIPYLIIPPLTEDEVGDVVPPKNFTRAGLLSLSSGNPLLLRYLLEGGSSAPMPSLADIAATRYSQLSPGAKEVLSYLAISGARLSMEELIQLVTDGPGSPVGMVADLEPARGFLVETVFGFTLKHRHQQHAIMNILQRHPQSLAYYSRRVGRLLRLRGDNVLAFAVLDRISDKDRVRTGYAAIFDASKANDYRTVRPILIAMIRVLGNSGTSEDRARLHLGLAEVSLALGEIKASQESLQVAVDAAKDSGDSALMSLVHEMSILQAARMKWDAASIQELHALRDAYREEGDVWSCGRLALEISAVNIRMDRFADAAQEASEARRAFVEVGDDYGESLATMNLASALSGLPGHEQEVETILRGIREARGIESSKRLRAWFANLMVRRLRREKSFAAAKRYAHEAIQIGNELGELHLVALNRINLGNVLRDEGKPLDALTEYQETSKLAHELSEIGTEASAERLISDIHLTQKKTGLALQHAQYAVAILQDSAASSEGAECFEQLGDVLKELGRDEEAAEKYLKAAALYGSVNDPGEQWRIGEYLLRVLAKGDFRMKYCHAIDSLAGSTTHALSDEADVWPEQLFRRLGTLVEAVPETRAIGVAGIFFQVLFDELLDPVARFLFVESSDVILGGRSNQSDGPRRILSLFSLLIAVPARLIYVEDLHHLAVEFERRTQGVHVKPDGIGAPAWTVVFDFKSPVICSINGFDESKETALIIFLLVIFFKGFAKFIQEEMIGDTPLIRRELMISVGNERHIPESIRSFLEPAMKESDSCVSRPTHPKEEQMLPTNVFFKDSIVDDWAPGSGKASKLQVLLGQTLLEVIFQLFGGEIDEDVLRPKLLRVIQETIS